MRTLSLTAFQLHQIRQTAECLPLNHRQQFFANVEDQLLPLDEISDRDVETAIKDTIARLHITSDRIQDGLNVCQ